jgi:hypothetical protein
MSELPKIEVEYHPQYRKINVNGIYGGARSGYFEFDIVSEQSDFKQALGSPVLAFDKTIIRRTIECKLVVDPVQAKSWIPFLQNQVQQYEKIFGPIMSIAPDNKGIDTGRVDNKSSDQYR